MYNTEAVPVIFTSDDYFVPYMSAAIQSILENSSPDRTYIVFVLHQNITPENAGLLKMQISAYQNFSIEFVDVTRYIKNYDFWIGAHKKIAKETYFRLLIPYIFREFKRAVYLDSDMICCTDIAELYDMEIGDNMLISTRDVCGAGGYYNKKNKKRNKRYSDIGIKNHDDYFIAGLLVFNIEKFRQHISLRDLLNFAVSRKWRWHDQDILNVVCENKVFFVPIEWDYYTIGGNSEFLPECWMKQYLSAQKNIKIIHFITTHKPWQNYHMVNHFEFFWKYAARTPFIRTIIERMTNAGYIQSEDFGNTILNNIKHRQGIGLKLIIKALFVWFIRDRKKSEKFK
ncbi:glucosyltransferase [Spirochaetia bacterium]|nr:glucosyltransferase [Spirochaetia bacterium]